MNLYSLTLQQPTCITKAIVGNFSGGQKQEIVVARGKVLEILKVDKNGQMVSLYQQEIFGIIQNIQAFKLAEGIKNDFILVLSDSGRIVVLKYDIEKNCFEKVHQESYGKTGCRRIVPGQYIATDPYGRACMIGAIEKQKFVYILNSENNKLTISSPLEAHKSHTITYDMVGIDTNYQNSQFACIECDYGDSMNPDAPLITGEVKKALTVYQLELGLNHVIKVSSDPLPESAHMLLAVPARDGPGGLIVLCEDYLIYRNAKNEESKVCPYPRRVGGPTDRKIMIVSHAFHKMKDIFFYLLQTEIGDLFKLTLHYTNKEVYTVELQYFDSVPVSSSLCILKKQGFLFAPCERGNHQLYKFKSIGQDENNPIITDSTMTFDDFKPFLPRNLTNLELKDELPNLSAITDIKVDDLQGAGSSQIYATCAAGTRSSLRILKHGLAVKTIGGQSFQGKPTGIFTVKNQYNGQTEYIVISFSNQTIVCLIKDGKIQQVKDTDLDLTAQTLYVSQLEDGSIIQITQNGIKHILKGNKVNKYMTEGKIIRATSNARQLVLGLAGGEIIYFELDSLFQLHEVEKCTIQDNEIVYLDIGDIPEGRQKCKFLAVGLSNNTVRILSLDVDSCLQKIAIQALPEVAESVALVQMDQYDSHFEVDSQLYLYVGMHKGILLRASVDSVTGNLSDIRTRVLGNRPVKCFKYIANGTPALLALSSKPWMCFTYNSKYFQVPLSYQMIDYAACFSISNCPEGIVCGVQNTLKIIQVQKYGEYLNQTVVNLKVSPRKLIINPIQKNLIILECDHRVYSLQDKNQIKDQLYEKYGDEGVQAKQVKEEQIGTLQAPVGCWFSQIRIYDPNVMKTRSKIPLEQNESAVSILLISFQDQKEIFVIVGTVKDFIPAPKRKFSGCYILTFVLSEDGNKLEFYHRTSIEEIPYALCPWKGKLLVGAGKYLRAYEMGRKQLLKKAEIRDLQNPITHIQVTGDRIFAGHQQESVHVYRYRAKDQTFYELADDILPRWISNIQLLDYHTVMITDKFENMVVCRVPPLDDADLEDNPIVFKLRWEQGYLNGAPFKMENLCNFYQGEVITSMQKAAISTGNEIVVHGTTMGSIGAFLPFETREDIDFFVHLEMHMRIEQQPLCGRDHVMFRSFYSPNKAVIDGDLIEQFNLLPSEKQRLMAEELDRTGADVQKKIDELRNKIL